MSNGRHIVVIGGGISGLATAHRLLHDDPTTAVTLLERSDSLGGKIASASVAGLTVDTGPDSLLVRLPAVRTLLDELGLADDVDGPAGSGAFVWTRGALRPLPPASLFGVPEKLLPLLTSGLVSPIGLARAGADLVLPRRALPADPTIGDLLRPRLGDEVFDRLVDPMLGGVHAGRADRLSARSAVPDVMAILDGSRSVYLTMRRRERKPASGPALVSMPGGMARLRDSLAASTSRADVRTSTTVVGLERDPDGAYAVHLPDDATLRADAVVVTTPAYTTADLLENLAPSASAALRGIEYVDVATVMLAYERTDVDNALEGTGFLVPPIDGRLLVGCSWLTSKWGHLVNDSTVVLRAMVGRDGDRRFAAYDDEGLVSAIEAELAESTGVAGAPTQVHVQRWPAAMPQYTVGHAARLAAIDTALAALPGLHVTGAAYRGVGLAGCISQAARTAAAVLDRAHATDITTAAR
jgi:protoporphyrinogen/coproporphyrinogen III oxidase